MEQNEFDEKIKYAQASAANATDVADLITTSVSASTYGICQS